MNDMKMENLEPKEVWGFFAGLAAVPRPSKKEEKIRAHVRELVKKLGLSAKEEPVGNIIVDVPATPGHESVPITVLQGHLDMVCEKNSSVTHDFDNEGIRTSVEEHPDNGQQIVRAEGTTLGADNGIGVALALAAATTPDVVHGPLELLFTIDEEAGMTGAKALTPDSFKGRRLINLDSEEDNALYIGCAGGRDTNLVWNWKSEPIGGAETIRVTVAGLRGGHSGGDIHENRGNAIKLLARTVALADVSNIQLVSGVGGSKRNAIPREAHFVLCGPSGTTTALQQAATRVRDEARSESSEPGLDIKVEPCKDKPSASVSKDGSRAFINAILALPNGVLGMSPAVPGLVQTSNNISTFSLGANGQGIVGEIGTLSRSSSESWKEVTCEQITAIGRMSGADVSFDNDYAGWDPNIDSKMLAISRRVYEQLFNEPPEVAAIHAGLECGIIGKRVGQIDMVSFGPTITGAHSPDEIVYVDSVGKMWKYLKAVLAELAKN